MTERRVRTDALPLRASLWVWLAVLATIVVLHVGIGDYERYHAVVISEQGLIENLTVLFALIAAGLCFAVFQWRDRLPTRWLAGWFLLLAAGCLLYAGEEASWGQHWFGWSSPEFFADQNRQGETNLHSLGTPSAQRLPELLLLVGVVIAGLVLPLYRILGDRRLSPEGAAYWILPHDSTWPTAALVLLTRLFELIPGGADAAVGLKETNEMLVTAFLIVYCWSVLRRLMNR